MEDEDILGGNTLTNTGSAYVFERNGIGIWNEVQKLVASDRGVDDRFGLSASISGNYAIIGAYNEDHDTSGGNTLINAGSAYVFERSGSGVWNEAQKLVPLDRGTNDQFGHSVSISGNYAIIGAYFEDEDTSGINTVSNAGSAYVFEKNSSGIWTEKQKIVASDRGGNDYFGWSVSISGNYVLIGAYQEDHDTSGINPLYGAGSSYLFERNPTGVWVEKQKIVASDRGGNDYFGVSVSISGNYAVIGAYREDQDTAGMNTLNDAGSAYLFERNSIGVWVEKQKIVASDRASTDRLGWSVSISGNNAVIGAYQEDHDTSGVNTLSNAGSAYVFELDFSTSSLDSLTTIECDSFVSISGKTWTTTGIYYDTVTNAGGCDSIVRYDLTINSSIVIPTIFLTACDSSQVNGTWYNTTQIVRDTFMTINNCDSIVNTDLRVNFSSSSIQTLTVCDSLLSPSGKTWTATGNYLDTILNAAGCDSLMTFNLTVNYTTSSSQTLTGLRQPNFA